MYTVELQNEMFHAIIPTLFLCYLLICYPGLHLVTYFIILVSISTCKLYLHLCVCGQLGYKSVVIRNQFSMTSKRQTAAGYKFRNS